MTIFEKFLNGTAIPMSDPDYVQLKPEVKKTFTAVVKMNNCSDVDEIREYMGEIIGKKVDPSTTVYPPFYTNYGKNIRLGKNVFINHACSFLDLGGITIEDNVMIGPRANISSEGHPTDIKTRKTLSPSAVTLKKNVWLGANVTILPGVTIGENAVVAAGAVVTKNVPSNTVVGGVPAKVLKTL